MRTIVLSLVVLALALSSAQGAAIYADANDGMLEARDTLPPADPWPQVHGDTFGMWQLNVGEWYGPGLTTIVLPFELPDVGAVADPFISADFGVMNNPNGGDAKVTDIDLYALSRIDASPLISVGDWYNGSAPDPTATLIQESFLTPASPAGWDAAPNNFTDATGDANLLSFMNDAYAGGANAGMFIFLRMSYGSDTFASGWDAYKINSAEADGAGEFAEDPVITYAAIPEPAMLGMFALGSLVLLANRRRRNG